jgi:O-antigen ligase
MRVMIARTPEFIARPVVIATGFCAAIAAWIARAAATGSVRDLLLGAGAAAAIPAALIALTRPMLFPYGFYAAFIPFDGFAQLGPNVASLTRYIGLAAAAALLFHGLRTGRLAKPAPSILVLGALCAYVGVSTLWSIAPEEAGREAVSLALLGALYLAAALYVPSRSDLRILTWAIIIGGVAASALGVYEFHHRDMAQTLFEHTYARIRVQIGSAADDPNMFADALLLPFALLAARWMRVKTLGSSLLHMGLLAILIFGAMVVASREATLAFVLVLLVVGVVLRSWRGIVTGLVMIGAGVLAAPDIAMRVAASFGSGGSERLSIWHAGWNAFRHYAVFGSGSGSFATAYNTWYLGTFQNYSAGWSRASHDFFLHYGVEFGVIGLGLAIAWWFIQWRTAVALPRDGDLGELRAALLAAVVAFAAVCVVVDAFDAKFVWLTFALIAQARSLALTQAWNAAPARART